MRYLVAVLLALAIGSAVAIPAAFAQQSVDQGHTFTFYGGDRN